MEICERLNIRSEKEFERLLFTGCIAYIPYYFYAATRKKRKTNLISSAECSCYEYIRGASIEQ